MKRWVLLNFGIGFFARGDVTIIIKLGNECQTHHNRANTEHRTCQTPVKCSSPSSLTFDVSPVASSIPRYIPRSQIILITDDIIMFASILLLLLDEKSQRNIVNNLASSKSVKAVFQRRMSCKSKESMERCVSSPCKWTGRQLFGYKSKRGIETKKIQNEIEIKFRWL